MLNQNIGKTKTNFWLITTLMNNNPSSSPVFRNNAEVSNICFYNLNFQVDQIIFDCAQTFYFDLLPTVFPNCTNEQ